MPPERDICDALSSRIFLGIFQQWAISCHHQFHFTVSGLRLAVSVDCFQHTFRALDPSEKQDTKPFAGLLVSGEFCQDLVNRRSLNKYGPRITQLPKPLSER